MKTFIIYIDNEEVRRFEHQEDDLKPLLFIQRNQGQSLKYALKYSGYKVEEKDEETNVSTFWK